MLFLPVVALCGGGEDPTLLYNGAWVKFFLA
ncbi:hypothetical protein BKA19_0167 [Blastococcus saxobsidens]|uniref:Uncharacterized protein n=1 Tax=Blastococcus saxobsidens TaxID=138336 RepID=A0A4Q7Y220_9ACTN|nr:hypothetical protein BKA19_0167 [Blastococcus saxobsidens]